MEELDKLNNKNRRRNTSLLIEEETMQHVSPKTARVAVFTEMPMSCYNCAHCKEKEDNQMMYDCTASNSITTISVEPNGVFLSALLPCDGDGWTMDLEFVHSRILMFDSLSSISFNAVVYHS